MSFENLPQRRAFAACDRFGEAGYTPIFVITIGSPEELMLFSRSSVVGRLALSAGALAVSLSLVACGQPSPEQTAVAPPAPLLKHPLALQLWSMNSSFAADGVPATLAKVKAMGFDHVELAGTAGLSREEFKAELDKAGLTPISMHIEVEALVKDPQRFIDDAKFFGVQYVGDAWFAHDGTFDAADADAAVETFNTAGRLLNDAGLTFFYHTHGFEFGPGEQGATLFDSIVARTDPETVKFQLDTFWAVNGNADPVALLEMYPTRYVSTHLKDMLPGTPHDGTGGAPVEAKVVLGTGEVDIKGVLEAARDTSVEWHIIEDESAAPETNIPLSIEYIRQLETVR